MQTTTHITTDANAGLIEHAMGQLNNPHPLTKSVIEIVIGSLGSIFDDEGDLTAEARNQITDMTDRYLSPTPVEVLGSTVNEVIATIRNVLPEGARLSLYVSQEGDFSITLHKAEAWLLEQGAEVSEWYAFSEGRCQRNLVIDLDGVLIEGVQTNVEAGLSLDECRAQNAENQQAA